MIRLFSNDARHAAGVVVKRRTPTRNMIEHAPFVRALLNLFHG